MGKLNLFGMKVKERLIFILLIFVSIVTINMTSSNIFADSDTSYSIESYKIDATVMKNGNIHVEEYLKYDFNTGMNGIYRDILFRYIFKNQPNGMEATSSRYQADSLKNINVYVSDSSFSDMKKYTELSESSLSNGISGYYSITDTINDGYRRTVKVYSPSYDESTKYIKYEYDVVGAVVKYNDAAEIYWNFLGNNWECSISDFSVNIMFEGSNNNLSGVKAYTHSYGNISDAVIYSEKVSFYTDSVNTDKAIDARVVFPASYIDYSMNTVNNNYDYEKLYAIEKGMQEDKQNYLLSNEVFVYIFLLAVVFEIFIVISIYRNYTKKMPKKKEIDYYTDPLDNLSLSEYNYLSNRVYGFSNSNLMLATILDLSHKKYITMECNKKVKKSAFAFNQPEYDYNLTLNEDKNLLNLTPYEITVINYLFNKKIGDITDISKFKDKEIELNKTFEKLGKNYSEMTKFNKKMGEYNKESQNKLFVKSPGNLYKLVSILFLIVVALICINIFVISPINSADKISMLILSLFFVGIASFVDYIIIYSSSIIVNEMYMNEYKMLMGLKKYLNDYSKIKERYPIELALWDRYLVFATIFGIANKVAKEFKEQLIMNGYDGDDIFINYPLLNMAYNSMTINSYAASSTGTSSSGGYSGGGSGGGGRWWWRRRSLLGIFVNNWDVNPLKML